MPAAAKSRYELLMICRITQWFFWIKTDDYGDCLVVHVGMSIYFVHPYDQDEDAYVYSFASNYGEHKAVEISPDSEFSTRNTDIPTDPLMVPASTLYLAASMKSQGCNQLRAIKLPYGPTLSKFHIHDFQGEQISCSAITPNGSLIAIASESGIIVLVSIPNNKVSVSFLACACYQALNKNSSSKNCKRGTRCR